jgi:biofilm PGA synthesis N-glycosyltransferase PgaC
MLNDIIDILSNMDWRTFLYFFWFLVLFDMPRYIFSLVAVVLSMVIERKNKYPRLDEPVSVILAGHNEADGLKRSVLSLLEQTQQDLEIIVVDDGSTDNTFEIGRELQREGLVTHVVTSNIRGGKAGALNLGLQYCSHEIIVSADMDTSFDRDAIENLVSYMNDPRTGAVAGNIGVRNSQDTMMTRMQDLEYLMSISVGRRFTSMMGILTIVSGAFGAFRHSALISVGGWDVGPGDDGNVTVKMRRSGWKVAFAPHALALTNVPVNIGGYIKQRMRWNRSVIRYKFRKFRSAFNPFSEQFHFKDAAALTNILFFQVVLSMSFFFYIAWLFYELGAEAFLFILLVTTVYLIEDMVTFLLAHLIYPERATFNKGVYLIAHTFFESYISRGIRMISYVDELIFRRSYKDNFLPRKVQNVLERF